MACGNCSEMRQVRLCILALNKHWMQELVGGWDVGGGGNLSEAGVLN